MAKTYSELLVVIAQRDLALAKLKLQIERDSREFHETYMNTLDSHKRDLASMASEYSESLKEKENQIDYWQQEVVKARKERDDLYTKLEREKEETKLALQRVERLKKRLEYIIEVFSNPTPPPHRLAREGETPDFVLGGLGFVIDTENIKRKLGLTEDSPETSKDPVLDWLNSSENPLFDSSPETLEDSPLTGQDSPETPKGWDSV